jgi:transcriptional regulator with XRE-family HTH domain
MPGNVHQVNIAVKGRCAWGGIAGAIALAHNVPMTHNLGPTKMREWRESRNLTLEAVAADLGITHGTLSKIERGQSPYNQRQLERLAELYDCEVIDLLVRAPDQNGANVVHVLTHGSDDDRVRLAHLAHAIFGNGNGSAPGRK